MRDDAKTNPNQMQLQWRAATTKARTTTKTTTMKSLLVALSFLALMADNCCLRIVEAKQYLRCELARKLLDQHGFARSLLSNWICMLEHESALDTSKVTQNPNGTKNLGLFQLNSKYCQEGRRGGICNAKCEEFIDEDIGKDADCAKRVQQTEGFRNWAGWRSFCSNAQNLPNLKVACGI